MGLRAYVVKVEREFDYESGGLFNYQYEEVVRWINDNTEASPYFDTYESGGAEVYLDSYDYSKLKEFLENVTINSTWSKKEAWLHAGDTNGEVASMLHEMVKANPFDDHMTIVWL